MKTYLVGGAVRDKRLGLPVSDRDWCVVGSTPDEMLALGYKPVGRDFPVFLHPESGEEYALARTERKTGSGYHGFNFHADPTIGIEDDLRRRDLTINAMAIGEDGVLTDPFGGAHDLDARILRHVSEAFVEDPVRILRVARFAARFSAQGFTVADDTMALMAQMVDNGEADTLVADRVWKETAAALAADNPQVFFAVLRQCGALRKLYPEIDNLYGVPQPEKWHPEIDCGVHTMMVLEQAARLSPDSDVRFAALVHDIGKATTDRNLLPAHHGHEKRSMNLLKKMARRLPIPNTFRDLGLLVAEYHGHCHRVFELKPVTILRILQKSDAFRRPQRFEKFIVACESDARGRKGLEDQEYPQANYLRNALQVVAGISARDFSRDALSGIEIGKAIDKARLAALQEYKSMSQPPK